MAKTSKKAPQKSAKTITDFFTRQPSRTPQSSPPNPSQQSLTSVTSGQSARQRTTKSNLPPQTVKPFSADSHTTVSTTTRSVVSVSNASGSSSTPKSRIILDAVEIVAARENTKTPTRNSMSILHPSKASDMQPIKLFTPRQTPKLSPTKSRLRKKKFDSDPDAGKLETVVYTSKSPTPSGLSAATRRLPTPLRPKENLSQMPQPNARKKPRLSSPEPFLKSVLGDIVPSSQSDEQDLVYVRLLERDPEMVKQNVDEWRHKAVSPVPAIEMGLAYGVFRDDMQMDVDEVVSRPITRAPSPVLLGPATGVDSLPKSGGSSTLFSSSPTFNREDTPPPIAQSSFRSPLPASPEILDGPTKAARIIEQIKAKALATVMSRPDSPTLDFNDELDDSSDEDDLVLWSPSKGKGKQTSILLAPQPSPMRTRRSAQDSFLHQDPSPSNSNNSSPSSSRRTRAPPNRGPVILTHRTKGKAKAHNPLDDLLREKRLANKRGKGDVAFRLAEVALAGKDALLNEMDIENDDANWADEEAARRAVAERTRIDTKSASPVASGSGSAHSEGDVIVDAVERDRLLGEERGKAVENILDGDRRRSEAEKAAAKVLGVSLWSDSRADELMAVDPTFPVFNNIGNHPLVRSLDDAVQRQNFSLATLLLNSGVLATLNLTEHPSVIPSLCEIALSTRETILNESAFRALSFIWENTTQAVPVVPFDLVLNTLVRLGAKPTTLNNLGWSVEPGVRPELADAAKRDVILYRLVGLITSSTRSGRLSNEEAPDLLVALLLVANDPTTSYSLQNGIMLAVDEICCSVATGDELAQTLESAICTKVLRYATTLTPINKSFIIKILAAGAGRTQRIARWIAHALVTDKTIISAKSYCDLPPLLPILDQITGHTERNSRETPGKFELHETTDYVDLCYHVQVLAVAVSNIKGYIEQERQAQRSKPIIPRNTDEAPQTILQQVHEAIKKLHSSISDVRAAHLDRSRAKAALNELSMRIYYQMLAHRGSGDANGKPRNLHQYFGTKGENTKP